MLKQRNVCIIHGSKGFTDIFQDRDWKIVKDINEADLVQLTGGMDINPTIYGQIKHHTTHPDYKRDIGEILVFHYCLSKKIPMAGVCRGGQLINALYGGSMWQDVDKHHGRHPVKDTRTGKEFEVNSIHHQMMIPHKEAEIILTASESKKRSKMGKNGDEITIMDTSPDDVEALFYRPIRAFCFQPHPELGWSSLTDAYFSYLHELIFPEGAD